MAFPTLAAQASVPTKNRTDWFYANGYFHKDQGQQTWTETIGSTPQYHFTEAARTDAYIQLYDSSRDLHVWLYADAYYVRQHGSSTTQRFGNGHWDDRRLYTYRLTDGLYYFNLYPGKGWRWARPSGYLSVATETLRNDQQIQVYDATAKTTFSFLDTQIWAKVDGYNWFKLADAAWN